MFARFTTERPVINGQVACPFDRVASVQECGRCTWRRQIKRTDAVATAVICRPPQSALVDIPPA